MKNNSIQAAEEALKDATKSGITLDQQQPAAAVGIGHALVAVAKGLGVIGAVLYLTHLEKNRGARADGQDAGVVKLDNFIQEGLGL